MSQGLFCPHCQLLNKNDAEVCAHCGFKLAGFKPDSFTTIHVSHTPPPQSKPQNRCADYAQNLSAGDLALFVMDEEEPILLEKIDKITLGRECDGLQGATLDLESYSPFELGISRKHVQISWDEDSYWLEDLRSTNGTWLNKSRIAAGMTYELSSEDKIWIGPLKLMICFNNNPTT